MNNRLWFVILALITSIFALAFNILRTPSKETTRKPAANPHVIMLDIKGKTPAQVHATVDSLLESIDRWDTYHPSE